MGDIVVKKMLYGMLLAVAFVSLAFGLIVSAGADEGTDAAGTPFTVNDITYRDLGSNEASVIAPNGGSSGYTTTTVIPSTVTYNSTTYTVKRIAESAFNESQGIKVDIPSSVDKIDFKAFSKSKGLIITFNGDITSIDSDAFNGASKITARVNYPSFESGTLYKDNLVEWKLGDSFCLNRIEILANGNINDLVSSGVSHDKRIYIGTSATNVTGGTVYAADRSSTLSGSARANIEYINLSDYGIARWVAIGHTFTVTYSKMSGTGGTSSNTVSENEPMPSISVPTYAGHTFNGYFGGLNGSGTQYYDSSGSVKYFFDQHSDTTLYSSWTANTYNITLPSSQVGYTLTSDKTTVDADSKYTLTLKISTGYTLSTPVLKVNGSVKACTAFAPLTYQYTYIIGGPGDMVVCDQVITVEGVTINQYNVTFKSQNGSSTLQTVQVEHGKTAVYSAATPTKTPDAQYTYAFAGWNSSTNQESATANILVNITADKTVYAAFSKTTNKYEVTITGEGVTVKNGGATVSSGDKLDYGTVLTVTMADKTGYTKALTANGTSMTSGNTHTLIADVTFNGTYTAKTYTVILKPNGGDADGSATATYGSNVLTDITHVTRTGYNISGYTQTIAGTLIANADGTLVSNTPFTDSSGRWIMDNGTTLYAKWTAKTYAITLDKGEGTADGSATATYDSASLTGITVPTYTGHSVEGYYTDSSLTTKVANSDGSLIANISNYTGTGGKWIRDSAATLYTKWNTDQHTVTFKSQDGSSTLQTVQVSYGGTAVYTAATPTKEPTAQYTYAFAGWNSSTNQESATANILVNITADKTVYAAFSKTTNKYEVTITGEGVTVKKGSATVSSGVKLDYGTVLTVTIADKTGYTKALTANGTAMTSGDSHALIADVTFNGTYTAKTYLLSLNEGAGTLSGFAIATYDSASLTGIEEPRYTGHTVEGYYTDSSLGTKVANADGSLIANISGYTGTGGKWIRDSETTLYTKWNTDQYTVTLTSNPSGITTFKYSINNGTEQTYTAPFTIAHSAKLTIVAVPNSLYVFDKWSDDDTNATRTIDPVTSDIDLTAKSVNYFTISDITYYITASDKVEVSSNRNSGAVTVPPSVTYSGKTFDVTAIGDHAFDNDHATVTSVVLPESIVSIGNYAFEYNYSLASVNIPSGVTNIGGNAFYCCSSLISIIIPVGVTSIGAMTFSGCSSLTSVTIGSGVTTINSWAFKNCTSLESIVIPSGVTSIGNSAFYGCTSLTSITIPDTVSSISTTEAFGLGTSSKSVTCYVYGCQSGKLDDSGNSYTEFIYEGGYDVTYMLDGVQYGVLDTVYYGVEVTVREKATKTGYTSVTDWTSSDVTITSGKFTMPAKDITITATSTPITYTIAFSGNGSTGGTAVSSISATYDQSYTAPSNTWTKTGYTFSKWNTEEDGSGTDYTVGSTLQNLTSTAGDTVTLYAKWIANTYAVTLDKGAGTAGGSATATYDSASLIGITVPTYTGHTVEGYYTDSSLGTKVAKANGTLIASISGYTDSSGRWIRDTATTLYTKWNANQYIVTFMSQYGPTVLDTVQVAYGDTAVYTKANPSKGSSAQYDYTFVGWNSQMGQTSAESGILENITADKTVYAAFSETLRSYTVTLVSSPASSSTFTYKIGTDASVSYSAPFSVEYGKTLSVTVSASTGYSFSKWDDDSTNATRTCTVTGAITWTATSPPITYTIAFDGNESTGGTAVSSISATYDQTYAAPSNTWTKSYCTFICWNTVADGSGTDYAVGTDLKNLTTTAGATVTLYAKWTSNTRTVTITNDISKTYNGSAVGDVTYTVSAGSGTVSIEYKKGTGTYSTTKPSDAGSYTVKVTVADDGVYHEVYAEKAFTIANANITGTVSQSGTLTYNASSQVASVSNDLQSVNSQTITVTYCATETGSYTSSVPGFTSAGPHTVYYKANAPNHNEKSGSFTVTIGVRDITGATINLNDSPVYNGSEQTQTIASVISDSVSIPASDYTVTGNKSTHVGDVTLTITGTGNCTGTTSVTWSIQQATQDISYSVTEISKSVDETFTNTLTQTLVYGTISYTSSVPVVATVNSATGSVTTVTNGITVITATVSGNADYASDTATYTLNVGTNLPTASDFDYTSPDNLAYTGTVKSASVTVKSGITGMGAVTVKYYSDSERSSEISASNVKDAGTYYVAIDVAPGASYVAAQKIYGSDWNFTVTKASLTVKANEHTITYGDGASNNGVTYTGFVNGENESVLGGTLSYAYTYDKTVAAKRGVGSYDITPSGLTSSNYDISFTKGTLTVSQKQAALSWTAPASLKYDGTAKVPSVEVSNKAYSADMFIIVMDVTSGKDNVNAGKFTFTVSSLGNANYSLPASPVSDEYEITKRNVTLTSATDSKVYTGTALTNDTVNVTGDGFITGQGATYDVTGTQTTVGSSDNEFTYTLNEGTSEGNYSISTVKGKLTVTAADITGTISQSGTLTYNASSQVASVSNDLQSVNSQTITVTYCATETGSYTSSVPGFTSAGPHTVYYKANAPNHNEKSGSFTVTIEKKEITISGIAALNKDYDGNTNATLIYDDVVYSGIVSGDTLTVTATGTFAQKNASNDYITVNISGLALGGASAGNYKLASTGQQTSTSAYIYQVGLTPSIDFTYIYEKTYDGNTEVIGTPGISLSGAIVGESPTASAYQYKLTSKNVGTKGVTASFISLDGSWDTNYYLTETEVTGNSSYSLVTPKNIQASSVVWNSMNPLVYTGLDQSSSVSAYFGGVGEDGDINLDGFTFLGTSGGATGQTVFKNAGTYTVTGTTSNGNYSLGTATESYTIGKAPLSVTPNNKTITYGDAAANNGVSYDGFVNGENESVLGGSLSYAYSYDITVPASRIVNNYSIIISGLTSDNYSITHNTGTLTVAQKQATLSWTAPASLKYDGTAKVPSVEVSNKAFAEDTFTIVKDVTSGKDNVNAGKFTFTVSSLGNANYSLPASPVSDEYEITKRNVTLTSATDSKVYDGTALTNSTVNVSGDGFITGQGATYDVTGTQTDVGSSYNTFTYTLNEGTSAGNYSISTVQGGLSVTVAPLKIKAKDHTITYGDDASDNGVTYTGFVNGEDESVLGGTLSYTYTYDKTVVAKRGVGSYDITPSGLTSSNYAIIFENGTLTVSQKQAELSWTAPASLKYDGTAKVPSVDVSNKAYSDDSFTIVKDVTSGKDNVNAGKFTFTVSALGNANYSLPTSPVSDEYEITKRSVTLTSGTSTRAYDGTALTNGTVNVTGDGFVGSEGATYNVTGSQTYLGSSDNAFTYTLKDNTKEGNYDITKALGTLTVNKIETKITITADSNTKMYDGTALTDTGYTFTSGIVVAGDVLTAVTSGTITDAGSADNVIASYKIMHGDDDVTDCYSFDTSVKGTLTVTKRSVTLTSATDSKVYDGTALTNGTVDVSGDGFVGTEGATYNVTGSQTDKGSSSNVFTYVLNADTKADNYDVTTVEGLLTVTSATIVIETVADVTYNGLDQKQAPVVKRSGTSVVLTVGTDYTLEYSEDVKNVGTVTVTATGIGNYEGTQSTTYDILPTSLIVTANAHSITYGDAASNNGVSYSGFVNGEDESVLGGSLSYEYTYDTSDPAKRTVGSYDITPSGLTSSNYSISFAKGTLTVEKKDLALSWTAPTALEYDGTAKVPSVEVTNKAYTDDSFTIVKDVTSGKDNVNAGKFTFTVASIGNDNYALSSTAVSPEYVITQRSLDVIPNAASKVYSETDPVITYSTANAVPGETPAFVGLLSRAVGENVGTYQINIGSLALTDNGSFKASNYTVVFTEGVLFTITEKAITSADFNIDLSDETYDGTPKVKSIKSALTEGTDYTVVYTDNINAGTAKITITGINNYKSSVEFTFIINKLTVSVPEELYYIETGSQINFQIPENAYYHEDSGKDRFGTAAGTYSYHLALNENCLWSIPDFDGKYNVYITLAVVYVTDDSGNVIATVTGDKGIRADIDVVIKGTYDVSSVEKAFDGKKCVPKYVYTVKFYLEQTETIPKGNLTLGLLRPTDVSNTDIYLVKGDSVNTTEQYIEEDFAIVPYENGVSYVFAEKTADSITIPVVIISVIIGIIVLICIYMLWHRGKSAGDNGSVKKN